MIITNELYIDISEQRTKLLEKWSLEIVLLSKRKVLIKELKLRKKLKKQIVVKETIILESQDEVEEIAISMIVFSSKITKPTLYDKAINDPIYGRCL